MGKVRIVTDSSAHFLDPDIITRYQIEVLPLSINLPSRSYREGIDVTPAEFLRELGHGHPPVRLIPPSVNAFAELYARLNRQTDQIISLHMSRTMSGTWDNANAATRTLLGRCEIEVVDSQTTSVGLAMLVEEAARVAATGASLEEVLHAARGMIAHMYTVFYVESLEYLRYNGLMSEAQSMLGSMLEIKPFLTIEEGELMPMEKVRSGGQAIDRLVEFVTEFAAVEQLVILQKTPYPTEQTHLLQERLAIEFPNREFPVMVYGPSLAALIGPDAMGVAIYESMDADDDADDLDEDDDARTFLDGQDSRHDG